MSVGGARPGAGRKKGTLAKVTAKAREAAMLTGQLPHEWLLKISRGEPIPQRRVIVKYDTKGKEISRTVIEEEIYPDFPTRVDAAKAAAPYYTPKLVAQSVAVGGKSPDAIADAMKAIAEKLPV